MVLQQTTRCRGYALPHVSLFRAINNIGMCAARCWFVPPLARVSNSCDNIPNPVSSTYALLDYSQNWSADSSYTTADALFRPAESQINILGYTYGTQGKITSDGACVQVACGGTFHFSRVSSSSCMMLGQILDA